MEEVIMVYQIKNSLLKKCPNTDVHNGLQSLQTILPNNTHFENYCSAYHIPHCVLIPHIEGTFVFKKESKKEKIKRKKEDISHHFKI